MSKNWIETSLKILTTLALYKEMSQYDLPSKVEKHYTTVLRQLRRLQGRGLVRVLRTQPSKKKGKRKKIYRITFKGIIQALQMLGDLAIDRVVELHADEWLIFQEWPFLLGKYGNLRVLLYSMVRTLSRQYNFLEGESIPPFTEEEIKQTGLFTPKEWQKYRSQLRLFVLEEIKQECTDRILGLGSLFGSRDISRFLLDKRPKEKWMLLKSARMTMKRYIGNPRIREYIDKRFEQEKAVHELVEAIRTQWKDLSKNFRS